MALLPLVAPPAGARATPPETLAAAAEAEGRRNRALARIDRVIIELGAAERRALADRMAGQIRGLLRPVRQTLEAAKLEIGSSVGPWDAISAGSREWKLRRALETAGVERAIEDLLPRLRERLGSEASALHRGAFAEINLILREEIAAPLGPRAGAALFDDLSRRLSQGAALRLDGVGRPVDVGVGVASLALPPAAGMTAIAARRTIAGRLGSRLAGRALGRAGAAAAMSPGKATGAGLVLDLAVGAAALAATVSEAGELARDAINGHLDRWYAEEIERPLLDGDVVDTIAAGIAAGVEERLRADRDAAAHLLERTYAGVVEQSRSPGFAEFAARADSAALSAALLLVPRVFGAEQVEFEYGAKLDLARRIVEPDTARRLVQRHGLRFVELFEANPADAAAVANAADALPAFAHILAAEQPADELLIFRRAVDRLGALDSSWTAALVRVRATLPGVPVESIRADGLTRVAAAAGSLGALADEHPSPVLRRIIGWLLDGSLAPGILDRIARHADAPVLAEALGALGPTGFEALLGAAGVRELASYLAKVPGAADILRGDGVGSLRFHRLAGGDPRAVLARERIRREIGGRIDPAAEEVLLWLLARTALPTDRIGLGLVRDLQAVGIPGAWPDAITVPIAGVLARTGLVLPLGVLLLLAAAPLLAWWTRLFPRRAHAPAGVFLASPGEGQDPRGRPRRRLPAP